MHKAIGILLWKFKSRLDWGLGKHQYTKCAFLKLLIVTKQSMSNPPRGVRALLNLFGFSLLYLQHDLHSGEENTDVISEEFKPRKGWRTVRTWPAALHKFKLQVQNNCIPKYGQDHSHDLTTMVKRLRKRKVPKD